MLWSVVSLKLLHSYSFLCDGTWHRYTIKSNYNNICLSLAVSLVLKLEMNPETGQQWKMHAHTHTHTQLKASNSLSHKSESVRSWMSHWQTQWSLRLGCHYGNQPSVKRLWESRCAPILFLMLSLNHIDCALNFESRVCVPYVPILTDVMRIFWLFLLLFCSSFKMLPDFAWHVKRKK